MKPRDFDLYQLLIAETRYLHDVWFSNFRLLMTINALLLPAMLAVFALILKGEIAETGRQYILILIAFVSTIRILINVIRIQIIRRINAIMTLRQNQVRRIEAVRQKTKFS